MRFPQTALRTAALHCKQVVAECCTDAVASCIEVTPDDYTEVIADGIEAGGGWTEAIASCNGAAAGCNLVAEVEVGSP